MATKLLEERRTTLPVAGAAPSSRGTACRVAATEGADGVPDLAVPDVEIGDPWPSSRRWSDWRRS